MSGFANIKSGLSKIESLERELNLKQLQINRLLTITQAINNNVSAKELYQMYQSFLGWELSVKKMALYIRGEKGWSLEASLGISEELLNSDITAYLSIFTHLRNIEETDHQLIREFDVVIPVKHKDHALAYVFIGGFGEDDDMYNKVQFITTITNIIAVAIENKRLFKRQLEQERLNREMELASEMQKMLIPKSLPTKEFYDLSSIYKPQMGVGGDYFDFMEFEDGKIVFCIGDISGKGIAAALLMANFQANFHTLINKRTGLDEFIRDLNKSVNLITEGNWFITFFIAEYDFKKQSLRYVNAGHNPPVVAAVDDFFFLDRGCTMLGSFKELPEVEVGECFFQEDALIFAFTDGLTDLRNKNGDFLNEKMLFNFVKDNYDLSATQFNKLLMERIEAFKGDQTYPDDFTILTCKIFNKK
ncbi:MAG: PP2C family protein-serine/threonine phosphatase [Saprospiraceae bacterium]|nr:PP2C family protein-serine/threonine phosphatase [Saprospiraceae bacterium]